MQKVYVVRLEKFDDEDNSELISLKLLTMPI